MWNFGAIKQAFTGAVRQVINNLDFAPQRVDRLGDLVRLLDPAFAIERLQGRILFEKWTVWIRREDVRFLWFGYGQIMEASSHYWEQLRDHSLWLSYPPWKPIIRIGQFNNFFFLSNRDGKVMTNDMNPTSENSLAVDCWYYGDRPSRSSERTWWPGHLQVLKQHELARS